MNWWEETHINKTYWLLENINSLNLTSEEALVLLMIDYLTTTHQELNPQIISQKCNLSLEKIDELITSLSLKNYLRLTVQADHVSFDYSNVFLPVPLDKIDLKEIFLLFEEEFGRPLTQPEMVQLNKWIKTYQKFDIIDALRYAVVAKKLSFNYINRILENKQNESKK